VTGEGCPPHRASPGEPAADAAWSSDGGICRDLCRHLPGGDPAGTGVPPHTSSLEKQSRHRLTTRRETKLSAER